MFGLLGGLKHAAHLQRALTRRTLIAKKPSKLVVQLRPIVVSNSMQTTTSHSFSTSASLPDHLTSDAYRGVGTIDDAIARSSGSSCSCEKLPADSSNPSKVQTIVAELPEIPRMPKKRTFHIKHTDLEARMQPLLSCHWHVGPVGNTVDDADDRRVLSLNKLFSFKNFRAAVDFFDRLADIQDEEFHHARVTVDYANVYVSVHTHVAYQPSPTSGSDADAKPIKVPGLTARDVRFAVQVERLHEMFLSDGRAVTKVPTDSTGLQAWSMEQLQRRYPPLQKQGTPNTS